MSCTAPAKMQVAHLRGEDRPDERARAGDRGEVVAEQDAPVRRLVVDVVLEPLRRRRAVRIDLQDAARDEARVEAVGDRVGRHRGEDQPGGGDLLPADQRDDPPRDGADDGDR
jgi:hypothetical protein